MEKIVVATQRAKTIHYSEAFKREIISEHLRTGIPKDHLQKKYGIKFKSAIFEWMKALGYAQTNGNNANLGLINRPELAKKTSKNPPSSLSELENEIALLKRRLEDEQLRAQMYNRMIDIAEKEYKISIRKNSNTK